MKPSEIVSWFGLQSQKGGSNIRLYNNNNCEKKPTIMSSFNFKIIS